MLGVCCRLDRNLLERVSCSSASASGHLDPLFTHVLSQCSFGFAWFCCRAFLCGGLGEGVGDRVVLSRMFCYLYLTLLCLSLAVLVQRSAHYYFRRRLLFDCRTLNIVLCPSIVVRCHPCFCFTVVGFHESRSVGWHCFGARAVLHLVLLLARYLLFRFLVSALTTASWFYDEFVTPRIVFSVGFPYDFCSSWVLMHYA
jgi:hypothetical protein